MYDIEKNEMIREIELNAIRKGFISVPGVNIKEAKKTKKPFFSFAQCNSITVKELEMFMQRQ